MYHSRSSPSTHCASKISDHRGRCRLLNRRATIGQIEAHHPEHPGAARIVSEYPEIVYQVTRGGTAALPAPIIKGPDLLLPLEPVGADGVKGVRQIKLMGLAAAVAIHVGPVICH